MKKVIILFDSTHQELAAEKVMKENGIRPKVIPAPFKLSAGCDIALELTEQEKESILPLLKHANINYKTVIEI